MFYLISVSVYIIASVCDLLTSVLNVLSGQF